MKSVLTSLTFLMLCSCAHARTQGFFHGETLLPTSPQQALQKVGPGSIVIVGENHGLKTHQDQQLQILRALRNQGLKVSVGMEFFTYTDQSAVQAFRDLKMTEADFLKQIGWGNSDYSFYRDQVAFPDQRIGEKTWALNAPRTLTGQVSKEGLESLSAEMKALLPPDFTLGRGAYKQRFLRLMPHLPSPEAGERYFAAQSIWDDTMAWQAVEFLKNHPDQVMVIIVGEFHSQFGGGLPDRIRARNSELPVWTVSQINTSPLSDSQINDAIKPSKTDGPRANWLWLEDAK